MSGKLKAAATIAVMFALYSGAQQRAHAQSVFPVILTLPGSAVALAMGGAYPITSARPDVIFYNPAVIRNARGMSISQERYGGKSTLTSLAASSSTNITVGVQVLDFGDASAIKIGDQSLALPLGSSTRAGEVSGIAGYARTVHGLRLGVAGKWVEHWGQGTSTGGASFDVGAYANPLNFLSVGLAAQNLGNDKDGASFDLPRRAQLTLATDSHEIGPLDAMATGEVHTVRGGKIGGGIGTELSYYPFNGLEFYARGGVRMGTTSLRVVGPDRSLTIVRQGAPTAGAGVAYKHMTFEYAWESFRGASAAHRFQVDIN